MAEPTSVEPRSKETPAPATSRFDRPAGAFLLAVAILAIASVCASIAGSIAFPYPLEWMEGGTVEVAGRVQAGEAIYCEPTLEYVPYLYPPLYYHAVSAIGGSLLGARALSVAAILLLLGVMAHVLWRQGCRGSVIVIALGLFVATFPLSGAWFHLARVDSLFVALLVSGLVVFGAVPGRTATIVSALLLILAFFTKQSTLLALLIFLPGMAITDRRRTIALTVGVTAGIGIGVLALQLTTDGWFGIYVFDLPRGHALLPRMARRFFTRDLLPVLPILVLAIAGVARALHRRDVGPATTLAALTAVAFASRIHEGGYLNVLMPLHAGLVLAAGPELARLLERKRLLGIVLIVAQFGILARDPRDSWPTDADRLAGDRFVETLATLPGPVLVTSQRGLAGSDVVSGFGMAGIDVLRSDAIREVRDAFAMHIRTRIAAGEFGAIVRPAQPWAFPDLSEHYRKDRDLFVGDAFMPVTGAEIRPEELWLPRSVGDRR